PAVLRAPDAVSLAHPRPLPLRRRDASRGRADGGARPQLREGDPPGPRGDRRPALTASPAARDPRLTRTGCAAGGPPPGRGPPSDSRTVRTRPAAARRATPASPARRRADGRGAGRPARWRGPSLGGSSVPVPPRARWPLRAVRRRRAPMTARAAGVGAPPARRAWGAARADCDPRARGGRLAAALAGNPRGRRPGGRCEAPRAQEEHRELSRVGADPERYLRPRPLLPDDRGGPADVHGPTAGHLGRRPRGRRRRDH